MYQGEELGLPEVLEIPDDARQDPTFYRSPGVDVGRDGCRVPLPWVAQAPSFGFGPDGSSVSHLPQPGWFEEFAVDRQDGTEDSTLELYRRALALRHRLQGPEEIQWLDSPAGVLAFERPGGWVCVSNFAAAPVELPEGELLLASAPLEDGKLPAATTAWLRR